MWTQRLMWIAWPAFLMAGVLEALVFAFIDPQDLHWFGQPITLSREGVYTIAFFVFWIVTMVSSAMTTLLAIPGCSKAFPAAGQPFCPTSRPCSRPATHCRTRRRRSEGTCQQRMSQGRRSDWIR